MTGTCKFLLVQYTLKYTLQAAPANYSQLVGKAPEGWRRNTCVCGSYIDSLHILIVAADGVVVTASTKLAAGVQIV